MVPLVLTHSHVSLPSLPKQKRAFGFDAQPLASQVRCAEILGLVTGRWASSFITSLHTGHLSLRTESHQGNQKGALKMAFIGGLTSNQTGKPLPRGPFLRSEALMSQNRPRQNTTKPGSGPILPLPPMPPGLGNSRPVLQAIENRVRADQVSEPSGARRPDRGPEFKQWVQNSKRRRNMGACCDRQALYIAGKQGCQSACFCRC